MSHSTRRARDGPPPGVERAVSLAAPGALSPPPSARRDPRVRRTAPRRGRRRARARSRSVTPASCSTFDAPGLAVDHGARATRTRLRSSACWRATATTRVRSSPGPLIRVGEADVALRRRVRRRCAISSAGRPQAAAGSTPGWPATAPAASTSTRAAAFASAVRRGRARRRTSTATAIAGVVVDAPRDGSAPSTALRRASACAAGAAPGASATLAGSPSARPGRRRTSPWASSAATGDARSRRRHLRSGDDVLADPARRRARRLPIRDATRCGGAGPRATTAVRAAPRRRRRTPTARHDLPPASGRLGLPCADRRRHGRAFTAESSTARGRRRAGVDARSATSTATASRRRGAQLLDGVARRSGARRRVRSRAQRRRTRRRGAGREAGRVLSRPDRGGLQRRRLRRSSAIARRRRPPGAGDAADPANSAPPPAPGRPRRPIRDGSSSRAARAARELASGCRLPSPASRGATARGPAAGAPPPAATPPAPYWSVAARSRPPGAHDRRGSATCRATVRASRPRSADRSAPRPAPSRAHGGRGGHRPRSSRPSACRIGPRRRDRGQGARRMPGAGASMHVVSNGQGQPRKEPSSYCGGPARQAARVRPRCRAARSRRRYARAAPAERVHTRARARRTP